MKKKKNTEYILTKNKQKLTNGRIKQRNTTVKE